jgi:predicted peptidase
VNGTLHYSIAFPPGYDSSGKRYPVVYFLHGLPADAWHQDDWLGAAVDRLDPPS